jgi:hypothetical protein
MKVSRSQAWRHTSGFPALGRLKQEDVEFKTNLGNIAKPKTNKEDNN